MSTPTHGARARAHLSRRERQRLARANAFSRRTAASPPADAVITFDRGELEVIERLVQSGRTAVSSAVLAIAGIGTGDARRRAVLAQIGRVACTAQAQGAISRQRGAQIARHVEARLQASEEHIAAAA
jgi:hypothetical protein